MIPLPTASAERRAPSPRSDYSGRNRPILESFLLSARFDGLLVVNRVLQRQGILYNLLARLQSRLELLHAIRQCIAGDHLNPLELVSGSGDVDPVAIVQA